MRTDCIALVAQTVKNLPAMLETWVPSLGLEDPPGEVNSNPLHYSCLENSMERGAWRAVAHGVAKKSDMTERLHFHFQGYSPVDVGVSSIW